MAEKKEALTTDIEDSMEETQNQNRDFGKFTLRFDPAWEYEGKTYKELTFDFNSLTGNDCLAIEDELNSQGKVLLAPSASGHFLVRMAAKACTTRLGSDVLMALPMPKFMQLRSRARVFLLSLE